jgi:hypothetical protein
LKPGIGLVNSELGMRNAEVGKSEPQNRRISNVECRRMVSLRSVYYIKVGVAVHPRLPCSVRWVRIIIEL